MTAVPTSAATTTINTFEPKVRILEAPLQKGAIGQKRRFHENTPAAHRGAHALVWSGLAKCRTNRKRVHGPLLRRCDSGWLDAGPKARRHATAQSDLGRNQIKLFRKARVLGAVHL